MKPWGRIICWARGKHLRGKPNGKALVRNKDFTYSEESIFRCPRCGGNERRYKVKPKVQP